MFRRGSGLVLYAVGLVTLVVATQELLTTPVKAYGPQCCKDGTEGAVGPNPGQCVFVGFCAGKKITLKCIDSTLQGQTPCSTVTGVTGWTDATCQSGTTGPCNPRSANRNTHNWSGGCTSLLDLTDPSNPKCSCRCDPVFGTVIPNGASPKQCSTGDETCP